MASNTGLVLEFIHAWSRRDLTEILSYLSPDCIWQRGSSRIATGHDEIKAALGETLGRASDAECIVHQIGTSPIGAVLTERLDRFFIGTDWVEVPVMGTFEIKDKQIVAWRDYFDPAQLPKS
jgi:limonene-1,2-epoxide hydrolase